VGFIALHIGAALYHQFIRRDRLLGRMWLGRTS
jgi:cytochrome b561